MQRSHIDSSSRETWTLYRHLWLLRNILLGVSRTTPHSMWFDINLLLSQATDMYTTTQFAQKMCSLKRLCILCCKCCLRCSFHRHTHMFCSKMSCSFDVDMSGFGFCSNELQRTVCSAFGLKRLLPRRSSFLWVLSLFQAYSSR